MTHSTLHIEDRLTAKQIKLIALEAKGVDLFDPRMSLEFSARADRFITSAMCGIHDFGDVVRRCVKLYNK